MKNYEKIVRERHSVRKYLDREIEEDKVLKLKKLIDECNSKGDLHIQLILDDAKVFDKFILHYGKLKNAKNYVALIGKKSKDLEEKVGYYGERIVLKAQELGLNTCWVAGTLSKRYITAKVDNNEKLICVVAIGYGENQGNERKLRSFAAISKSVDSVPNWYKRGIEYVLMAPSAINQQKYSFELLDGDYVRAIPKRGHLTRVDLGIAKYHFEIGAGINNFKWK